MTLNTMANVTSPHSLERWMGAGTRLVALGSGTLAAFSVRSDTSINRDVARGSD